MLHSYSCAQVIPASDSNVLSSLLMAAEMQLSIRYKCNKDTDALEHTFSVDPANKAKDLIEKAVAFWQLDMAGIKYYLSIGKTYLPSDQKLSALVEMGKLKSGDIVTMTPRLATATGRRQRDVTIAAQHAATLRAVDTSKQEVIDHVVQVENKVDTLLGAYRGVVPARAPGQTNLERLKQLRTAKRRMDNEIVDLAELESDRRAVKKRDILAGITAAAELADGSVQLADLGGVNCGDLTEDQLKVREDEAKAVLKTIATRKRQIKKADAQPKAQPKAIKKAGTQPKAQPKAIKKADAQPKAQPKASRGSGGRRGKGPASKADQEAFFSPASKADIEAFFSKKGAPGSSLDPLDVDDELALGAESGISLDPLDVDDELALGAEPASEPLV